MSQTLNVSDTVIHISEKLDDSGIHGLQRGISKETGVYRACMHEKTRHLIAVDFDPMEVCLLFALIVASVEPPVSAAYRRHDASGVV